MADRFTSVGAAMSRGLFDAMMQREAERRQTLLDGVLVEDKMRARAREDMQAQRQARIDEEAAADRQRRIAAEDMGRDLAPFAPGDLVDDSIGKRYPQFVHDGQFIGTPQQRDAAAKEAARLAEREADRQQRELDKADAAGNRYLDTELARQEREANRRSNEEVARINQSGRGNDDRPLTEGQRKTAGLLSRGRAARVRVDQIEPSIGTMEILSPNWLNTAKGQRYKQASKQWIQSVLRDESGAAIGKDEEQSYFETYFVQPNDSPEVIADKKQARLEAEDAMDLKIGGSGGATAAGGNGNGGNVVKWGRDANGRPVRVQ